MEKNKNALYIVIVVVGLLLLAGAMYYYSDGREQNIPQSNVSGSLNRVDSDQRTDEQKTVTIATIQTSEGEIKAELYDNDAPKTVANFIKLAQDGFYDELIFHRVIKDFMIQGGDPNCTEGKGNGGPCGTGGPGYEFGDELDSETASYQAGYQKGVLAMANHGPNTNGSQFFIMLRDTPLSHDYTIFGKVISGQEVVDKIGFSKTDENDRPVKSVVIQSIKINN